MRRGDVLLERVGLAGDGEEVEDPATVVVEQHDRERAGRAATPRAGRRCRGRARRRRSAARPAPSARGRRDRRTPRRPCRRSRSRRGWRARVGPASPDRRRTPRRRGSASRRRRTGSRRPGATPPARGPPAAPTARHRASARSRRPGRVVGGAPRLPASLARCRRLAPSRARRRLRIRIPTTASGSCQVAVGIERDLRRSATGPATPAAAWTSGRSPMLKTNWGGGPRRTRGRAAAGRSGRSQPARGGRRTADRRAAGSRARAAKLGQPARGLGVAVATGDDQHAARRRRASRTAAPGLPAARTITYGRPPLRPVASSGSGSGPIEHERLAQREVEVDGSRRTLGRRRSRRGRPACGSTAGARRRRLVDADLEEPLDRVAVQLELVDRLSGADVAELGRAVGRQHDHRHAGLAGLDHRRREVGRGGARRARDRDRPPGPLRGAEREEARAPLVDVRPAADPRLAGERQHDRGASRPGRRARVLHPAAGELVAERAQQQVGVGHGHDAGLYGARCRPPARLHPHRRELGPRVAALSERYRALAPDIRGHGSASEREPVTLEAVLGDVGCAGARAFHARRVLDGWPDRAACRARAGAGRAGQRLVLVGASPGIADPAERAERRAADERLADEIERMTIEEFATRWAADARARRPASRRGGGGPRRPAAESAGGARAGAARSRHGRAAVAVGPARARSDVPVALVVGERDEKFRAIAIEMAAALPDSEVAVVPGAGHAVHLEAPERVAALLRQVGIQGAATRPGARSG